MTQIKVTIQQPNFSLQDEYEAIRSCKDAGEIGAIASFVGLVRDRSKSAEKVTSIKLSTYQLLAEKQINELAHEAESIFPLQAIHIIHRFGELKSEEQIVLVICASKHRKAALQASDYIMDHLKSKVAFWKKELSDSSPQGAWIEPSKDDLLALDQWEK